ncbi:MAG: cytochrome c, partial [Flavobacteriales bacterium]|nr:cytochrome c [Flavobacteriales bacterium]
MTNRTSTYTLILLLSTIVLGFVIQSESNIHSHEASVSKILNGLGEPLPDHWVEGNAELIQHGYNLIHEGRTEFPNQVFNERISKHFVCVDCHNTDREDPVLTQSDPEGRLAYCIENGIPFLPATTLWGIVNRESWYNGDYQKKYGDLVKASRNDLREAIQLCATECSQGRLLSEQEMLAVLSYLWSLELTWGDLPIHLQTVDLTSLSSDQAIAAIKSGYNLASPATFLEPRPIDDRRDVSGNPQTGWD